MFYIQILLPGPVHTQSVCHSFSMGSQLPFDLPLISCNGAPSNAELTMRTGGWHLARLETGRNG